MKGGIAGRNEATIKEAIIIGKSAMLAILMVFLFTFIGGKEVQLHETAQLYTLPTTHRAVEFTTLTFEEE